MFAVYAGKYAHLLEVVKGRLSEERWEHSRGVATTAMELAGKYGGEPEKAFLAGILHDLAKEFDDGHMLKLAAEFNIISSIVERNQPNLLHGPVAAALVQRDFGITDPEILAAIANHTLGAAGMGLLEKIIYLADFIEPGREFPGVGKLRRLAQWDLDEAVLAALEHTFLFLLKRGLLIHPAGIMAWNDLMTKRAGLGLKRGLGEGSS